MADVPKNSLLTASQRKLLQSGVKNTSSSRVTRSRMRNRVRAGLRDFRILADHLEGRDREAIFNAEPRTKEYRELQGDAQAAIEFIYAGLGGESGFRRPLERGVANGELELGNIENVLDIAPRFTVNFLTHVNRRDTVEAVEAGKWDRLSPPDLFAFLKMATQAEVIDFESLHKFLDRDGHLVDVANNIREVEDKGEAPWQNNNPEE